MNIYNSPSNHIYCIAKLNKVTENKKHEAKNASKLNWVDTNIFVQSKMEIVAK